MQGITKIKQLGEDFDERIKARADKLMKGKITNCKTKAEIKAAVKDGKIARVNFCSVESNGAKCAEYVEKEINAEVRGTMANKREKAQGNCVVCGKSATEVVYIAKAY